MGSSVSTYIRQHHLGLIAIFIALTGTAFAANGGIGPKDIAKNAVRAKHVKNGQVGTKDVADGTTPKGLTGTDLVDGSVSGADVDDASLFNDNSLDAADVADNSSLGTAEVDEGTLFNDDSLTAGDIGPDSVGASEIVTNGVGAAEVANNTIGAEDIVDGVGGIEADIDGDFTAGSTPTPGDDKLFFQVNDNFMSVGETQTSGSSVAFAINSDTLASTFSGDVFLGSNFLQLTDQSTLAGDPPGNMARLYLRGTAAAGDSELVIDWANGGEDVIAAD